MSPYLNDFNQVDNAIMDTVSKEEDFVKRIIVNILEDVLWS
jgi:hypothetical protein